jgi:UDP-glucose 4-epimerase
MRVAVTGATGALGQWTLAALQAAGHELLAVARRPRGAVSIAGVSWPAPIDWVSCDLEASDAVARLGHGLAEVDAVVHLAGHRPDDAGGVSLQQALATLRANVVGTAHLLDALSGAGRLRRVVYASSSEVYGPPHAVPIREDHPTRPLSYYGASKLAGEHYVRLFNADRRVPWASLRLPSLYGPGDRWRGVVGDFVSRIATGRPPVVRGDGAERRDLLYLEDAARGIVAALASRAEGVFNLGSGRGFSILEIAETACRAAGMTSAPLREPSATGALDYVLDIGRARSGLGWEPRTNLERGLAAQLVWHRQSAP